MASKSTTSTSVEALAKQISDMGIASKPIRQPGTSQHQKQPSQSKLPTKFVAGNGLLADRTNTTGSVAVKMASAPAVKSGLSKQITIVDEPKPKGDATKATVGMSIGHYDGGLENDEKDGTGIGGEAAEVLALDSSTLGYVPITLSSLLGVHLSMNPASDRPANGISTPSR